MARHQRDLVCCHTPQFGASPPHSDTDHHFPGCSCCEAARPRCWWNVSIRRQWAVCCQPPVRAAKMPWSLATQFPAPSPPSCQAGAGAVGRRLLRHMKQACPPTGCTCLLIRVPLAGSTQACSSPFSNRARLSARSTSSKVLGRMTAVAQHLQQIISNSCTAKWWSDRRATWPRMHVHANTLRRMLSDI